MQPLRQLPRAVEPVLSAASRAGGWALAAATACLAAARPARKPLHPRGQAWDGVITRHGSTDRSTGVAWLDGTGTDAVQVRISAAIGLPETLPDIHGLAIRLHQPQGSADILLATTGTAPGLRHVLRFTRSPTTHAHTTLLPYRSPVGPVLLAATPCGERRFDLAYAVGGGPWRTFGRLDLVARTEARISFDPILHPPAGLENYSWVSRLRAPAYRTARRSRR